MRFSLWTQKWQHEATVAISQDEAFHALLEHYRKSSKSFRLLNEAGNSSFEFSRGYTLMSVMGIGSERLLKHRVTVQLSQAAEETTSVKWLIDLKIFGLQVCSNAIIEECKQLTDELAKQINSANPEKPYR